MFKKIGLIVLSMVSLSIFAIDGHPQKATYELTFNSTWSPQTHPENFPNSAHFSSLIGLTHQNDFHLWRLGDVASNGVKQTAEVGSNSKIRKEIKTAIRKNRAQYLLETSGIDSPDSIKLTFDIDQSQHYLSLISMLAPSADWFVGIDAYPLYEKQMGWVEYAEIDLLVYDAGTKKDSPVFEYYNDREQPKKPIILVTHQDSDFKKGKPAIGQFILKRLHPASNFKKN
ncbi:Spondin-2 precursor [uncultured Candidatus Thioglobus sp.]|nr:Spondin-2 precursor [uncultured Candidatus Thioglobus sp.]